MPQELIDASVYEEMSYSSSSGVPTAVRPAYIDFRVYAPLDFGETLVVTGSTLVLGKQDPEEGTALVTSSSAYPVWRVEKAAPVFPHEEITYRYAIFSGGKFDRWEDGTFRKVIVKPEELEPLTDGSPSRTLVVADKIETPGLLRWGDAERLELANADCSVEAIEAASAEFAAKQKDDESFKAEPRPKKERDDEIPPLALEMDGPPQRYLSMRERNELYDNAQERFRKKEALKKERRRKEKKAFEEKKASAMKPKDDASNETQHTTRPPSPRSAARRTTASAALQAFLEEEARPPGVESAPLTATDGVVVASLFLPVLVNRHRPDAIDGETRWEVEWDLENLLSLQAPLRVTRVGLARVPDDTTSSERMLLTSILRRAPWFCIAIFIDRDTYNGFYHTFCKGVLWPVFHNSLEVYGEKATPSLEFDDAPFGDGDGQPDDDDWEGELDSKEPGSQTTHAPSTILAAVSSAHDLDAIVKKHQSLETFSDFGDPADDETHFSAAFHDMGAPPPGPPTSDDDATPRRERQQRQQVPRALDILETPPLLSPADTGSNPQLGTARKRTTRIDKAWRAYKRVNQIFREHVVEAYNEGDLIWIHGFQLALLPAFVSRRLTVAKVGLFLHTPFPSSEIFRTLSMRAELLRGMLSADQVGFHLYEYARHFLTTARRLLGARYTFDARGPVINVDGRDVVISCMHAGVEPADLADVANTKAGIQAVKKLRKELGLENDDDPTHFSAETVSGKQQCRIIAGIDKLERLRGLPLKLLAYERFLDARAKRRKEIDEGMLVSGDEGGKAEDKDDDKEEADGKKRKEKKTKAALAKAMYQDDVRVVLVQYALSSFERNDDCERTRRDSLILCDRIRAKHGEDCLVWREVLGLAIVDRLALLKIADVFWVSSVRDGLNRWPLEYVAMQSDNLLGVERHTTGLASDDENGRSFAKTSEAPPEVVKPYFDDLIRRMTSACDGQGYPAEDPASVFKPKLSLYVRQKRRRMERKEAEAKGVSAVIRAPLDDDALDAMALKMGERQNEIMENLPDDSDEDDSDSDFDDFLDLANETFPSAEAVDDDERFAEACERRAKNEDGEPLSRPPEEIVPASSSAARRRQQQQQDHLTTSQNYLLEDQHDYMVDAKGKKYVVMDLTRRALSRRSRRTLRAYLASGDEAKKQHAARHARCQSRRLGALLLSENASATRVLLGAVASNPWRIDESAAALGSIIAMKSRERMSRHALDADFLARSTTAKWAYRCLHDLKAMRKDANRLNATHAGLGLNFRVLGMRSGFDALQTQTVAKAYRDAGRAGAGNPPTPPAESPSTGNRRFLDRHRSDEPAPAPAGPATATRTIVLDYGGTLVPDAAATSIDSVSAYAIAHGERTSPTPSDEVKRALVDLANDPRNVVFVVSGRERADLLDSLGDVLREAPDLGLAAEHGFFVRWPRALRPFGGGGGGGGVAASAVSRTTYVRPTSRSHDDDIVVNSAAPLAAGLQAVDETRGDRALSSDAVAPVSSEAAAAFAALAAASGDDEATSSSFLSAPVLHQRAVVQEEAWERPFSLLSDDRQPLWRDTVLNTMDMFTQRTQGTYIEKHESSLVWQYRDADPDYGEMQAKELENQLADAIAPFASKPQILRGENPSAGGYVEVRPAGVDKGAFLNRLLRALSAAGRPADFALVVGDDESDEPMFRALSTWTKDRLEVNAYSVCIGKKPSEAESYVDSHDGLLEILQALGRISSRSNRYYSAHDLTYDLRPTTPTDSDMFDAFNAPGLAPASRAPSATTQVEAQQRSAVTSSFLRGVRSLSMPVRSFSLGMSHLRAGHGRAPAPEAADQQPSALLGHLRRRYVIFILEIFTFFVHRRRAHTGRPSRGRRRSRHVLLIEHVSPNSRPLLLAGFSIIMRETTTYFSPPPHLLFAP